MIKQTLEILANLKAFHWLTTSHAQHLAFEQAYQTLSEKFDALVETYQGWLQYPTRLPISDDPILLHKNVAFQDCIENWCTWLETLSTDYALDCGSSNIRDECVAALNLLAYRLSLS